MLIAKELNDVGNNGIIEALFKNYAKAYLAEPDENKRDIFLAPNLKNVLRNYNGPAIYKNVEFKLVNDEIVYQKV